MNNTTAWNLGELRALVKATSKDSPKVIDIITSIDRSTRIFHYHMTSARDAMNRLLSEEHPSSGDNLLLVFGVSDNQTEFEYAKIVSEAHLIGCLHTARGLWDLFAQLVNALVITKPLNVHDCDIKKVKEKIEEHSTLKSAIDQLLDSHWYAYIEAFVNTTKHRLLIKHMVTLSFQEDRAGIRLEAFSYRGKSFKSYWSNEVLIGAIEVKNTVIHCGKLLNANLARL